MRRCIIGNTSATPLASTTRSSSEHGTRLAPVDNLLVILVLVAIITGIVIDSFGARREQDDDKTDQLANSCETRNHCALWHRPIAPVPCRVLSAVRWRQRSV